LLFEQVVTESLECYGVEFFEALVQGAHNSSSQFVRLGSHPTIPRFFAIHAPAGLAGTVAVGLMGMPLGLEGLLWKRWIPMNARIREPLLRANCRPHG
jgi:hypothetical protein